MDNNMQNGRPVRPKTKFLILILSLLLVFLIPFLALFATVVILDPVYDETFVGELGVKYDLLT